VGENYLQSKGRKFIGLTKGFFVRKWEASEGGQNQIKVSSKNRSAICS